MEKKLSKSVAEGIIASTVGSVAGTAIFESLNIAYPFTIPAKIAVTVGVIEILGHTILEMYERKYNG